MTNGFRWMRKPDRRGVPLRHVLKLACAICLLLTSQSTGTDAAWAQQCQSGAFPVKWGWQEIRQPNWPENNDPGSLDGAVIEDYAVDPSDSRRIFVTDGIYVMMTQDEGCTWREVFSTVGIGDLPEEVNTYAGEDRPENRVWDIVIPQWGDGRVYLSIQRSPTSPQGIVGMRNPPIVVSDNGVNGWRDASAGLPLETERAFFLLASPYRTGRFYALIKDDAGGIPAPLSVHVTTDGGNSWELRSRGGDDPEAPTAAVPLWASLIPGSHRASGATEDLILGLRAPSTVDDLGYLTNKPPLKMVQSMDGGRSWEVVSELPTINEQTPCCTQTHRPHGLTMGRSPNGGLQGAAFIENGDKIVHLRTNDGRLWREAGPGPPDARACSSNGAREFVHSAAIGKNIGQLVATIPGNRLCDEVPGSVYRYSERLGHWLDITPYGVAYDTYCGPSRCDVEQVTSYSAGRKTHFYMVVGGSFGRSALFRYTGGSGNSHVDA